MQEYAFKRIDLLCWDSLIKQPDSWDSEIHKYPLLILFVGEFVDVSVHKVIIIMTNLYLNVVPAYIKCWCGVFAISMVTYIVA